MRTVKRLLLTRTRLLFWLWYLPGLVWLVWMTASRPDLEVAPLFLFMVWVVLGFWAINGGVGLMRRSALGVLDGACDPEPLLELCRAVIRQNPRVVSYRVLEAWALLLLGKEEEALASANLVEGRWKLRRSAPLLLAWCAVLPPHDPRRRKTLEGVAGRFWTRPSMRRAAREMLAWDETAQGLKEAPAELEPVLRARLSRADCTREQVTAHLALGVYFCKRGDTEQARTHLAFVVAHGGKLAVRDSARELLEGLEAEKTI